MVIKGVMRAKVVLKSSIIPLFMALLFGAGCSSSGLTGDGEHNYRYTNLEDSIKCDIALNVLFEADFPSDSFNFELAIESSDSVELKQKFSAVAVERDELIYLIRGAVIKRGEYNFMLKSLMSQEANDKIKDLRIRIIPL